MQSAHFLQFASFWQPVNWLEQPPFAVNFALRHVWHAAVYVCPVHTEPVHVCAVPHWDAPHMQLPAMLAHCVAPAV